MPGKFCPKCGKQDVDFYEGLCLECYKEENKFTEPPNKIDVETCRKCGYWKYRGEWKKATQDLLKKFVKDAFETNLFKAKYSVELSEEEVKVNLKGKADFQGLIDIEEDYSIPINFEEELCPVCRKIQNKKYKVELQIRRKEDHDEEKFKEVDEFINSDMRRMYKRNHKAHAFWQKRIQEGKNYYFGYQETANRIKNRLKKRFGLQMKVSTRKAGRDREGKKKANLSYMARV